MVTYEGIPTFQSYLAMRLAKAVSKRKERQSTARPWITTIVRLALHIAGFSLLTWAGFTWNMPAGLITAGISCFVLSHLATSSDTAPETDAPTLRR